MSSTYSTVPGALGTFQYNALGLADLALPDANHYSSCYLNTPSFLTHTPSSSPTEVPVANPLEFSFSDEIFAGLTSFDTSRSSTGPASEPDVSAPVPVSALSLISEARSETRFSK